MKKAQAALEFLMTYGWAIFIVIIGIGLVIFIADPESILPEKCTFPTSSGVFCDKYSAQNGSIELKLENHLDETITVVGVNVSVGADVCMLDVGTTHLITTKGSANAILQGATCSSVTVQGQRIDSDINLLFEDSDGFLTRVIGDILVHVN